MITEDTVTRGTSPMEAVRVVRELGAEPVLILVLVDRGGTCGAMAEAEGVAFRPSSPPPSWASTTRAPDAPDAREGDSTGALCRAPLALSPYG